MEVKSSNWIYISIIVCGLFISYVTTQQALGKSNQTFQLCINAYHFLDKHV